MLKVVETESAPRVQAHTREGVNDTQLRAYVERIARLHEERKALADDVSDILKEAESTGYDKTALKIVVKAFGEDADKRQKRRELDDVTAVYFSALGLA